MAQSVGHELFSVVDTGIGPVFALALLIVKCTLAMFCLYFSRDNSRHCAPIGRSSWDCQASIFDVDQQKPVKIDRSSWRIGLPFW